ncbi:MAG TPA: NADP-dependent oxidoreductase [Jatrophihabitans sp.]|jgi:NADPH:quinone reductase-like Zn-dependent oxidoreductase
MKAVTVRHFGAPDVLEFDDLPVPGVPDEHVRIRVVASCVNPIDLSVRAGRLTAAGLMTAQAVLGLGWDVSGVVDAVGARSDRFEVGRRVIGLRDLLFAGGAHAEYVTLHESAVAPAPASVSAELAATIPLNALTADRALALTGLRRGDTLLVTGAAGAVGGFVVELAARQGIRTLAYTRPGSAEAIPGAGVEALAVDSAGLGAATREIVPGGVDAVVDAAVMGIGAHEALRGEGTFVALVAPFAPPPIRATRVVVQEVFADGARLADLAALVDAGQLTPRVAETLPLAQARRAHELAESGGLRGKVVLTP